MQRCRVIDALENENKYFKQVFFKNCIFCNCWTVLPNSTLKKSTISHGGCTHCWKLAEAGYVCPQEWWWGQTVWHWMLLGWRSHCVNVSSVPEKPNLLLHSDNAVGRNPETAIGWCWLPNLVEIRKFYSCIVLPVIGLNSQFLIVIGFWNNNNMIMNHRGQSTHKDNLACYCSHPWVKKSPQQNMPSIFTICFLFIWV